MPTPTPIDVLMTNPPVVSVSDITDGTLTGAGVFDKLMLSVSAHLRDQLDKGRIQGTDFSAVYLEALKHTMSVSVELSLAKQKQAYEIQLLEKQNLLADEEIKSAKLSQDNAKKQNKLIERQTILADAQLDLIHYDLNTKFPAEVANTLKQGLILDKETTIKQYQIDSLLPNELARGVQQLDVIERTTVLQENQSVAEVADTTAATAIKAYQLNSMMPVELDNATKQGESIDAQIATSLLQQDLLTVQIETGEYTLATDMPISTGNLTKQGVLLDKQADTADAQIANVETQTTLYEQKTISEQAQTDETVIGTGSLMDEQRLLVREQRLGFERDNMHKVAKVYADNWLARYTEQPGDTFAPDANLNDENAKQVMTKLLASLGLTPIAPAPAPPTP